MAAFHHFGNMNEVAFKPRLLLSLIRDHLPDEKSSFSDPSKLSKAVSLLKTHSLLSESFLADSTSTKVIEAWKSAFSSWLNRIFSLLSTSMPDKCWAGITLLGVTCEECSSERFLESYSAWFNKLLAFLQSPADSHLVKVAACASLSDIFIRLSGYPKIKKESSSCAVKVVQPTLKMLTDENSEAIWDAAVHLLCTIATSFPFSIRSHYDGVESAIALKLLSGGCSLDMSQKLAHCLALLPKSKGDNESWSVMMQKILVLINDQLNLAFHGLEEETMRDGVTRLLVLPGEHPPPPLGGYILAEEVRNNASQMTEQSLMSNVSTLMSVCCLMLTNSYPVKVNVPVRLLLVLVERVLKVNGSLPQTSMPFVTAKQQENICSELPALHLSSLELLTAILKSLGSQLLPHAAYIVLIITKYFKTCELPKLRIKVYSVTKNLLITMGVGMALYLAQEVINNAFTDLSSIEHTNGDILNGSISNAPAGAKKPSSHRKRKHINATGSLQEHDQGGGLGLEVPKNCPLTPISLRIAALETLEALVTVAGALKSEPWRSKVDSLLIVIATDSFKEGTVGEEFSVLHLKEPAATVTDLQLAALRALLASFLSFGRGRPPYLSEGLELFRRGKQQTSVTKLAEFCVHALLTLEVLIHPRALPLVDYTYNDNNSFGEAHSNLQHEYFGRSNKTPYGLPQVSPDYDDDVYAEWLENGNEADVPMAKDTKNNQETSEACRDNDPEVLPVHVSSDTNIQKRAQMDSEAATSADVEMKTVGDETNFKSYQPGESAVQFQDPGSFTLMEDHNDIVSEKILSDSTAPHNEASHTESDQGNSVNKDFASQSNSLRQTTTGSNIFQEFSFNDNSLADEDGFPDIVDGDPDSDYDEGEFW
ncbi:proline-, glutamic acid- and leucine-rich protein 1 [Vigna radiata var. radiata]|uniref:Proline-, glutamic acid- and leucine-rich protein 1 n=1 Tax=Vigna radiata var. radiata TaxID=3916 RepID=A0A1S3VAQ2_VIGRR|nr:proline-, glutamic acid- and leucine-rich protein 1 [Vigna radiata var. radiata]